MNLMQLPTLPSGQLESWLLAAMAAGSMALVFKKLFSRKPPVPDESVSRAEFQRLSGSVERELEKLHDRLDARFLGLNEKLDALRAELLGAQERGDAAIQRRLNELEAGFARVDERTRR